MRTRCLFALLITAILVPSFARAQSTERGAAIGGIGGALAGAAIGKKNGDTTAGALIGGAVGLVTGAAVGNAADERDRRYAVRQEQAYLYARAASSNDVVTMVHNGVGDEVIINHIREHGVQRRPDVSEVIALHKQGVSERVITAMQTASEGGRVAVPPPSVVYRSPPPVVVEEYYYVRPAYRYYPPPPPHYHYYGPYPRNQLHWGISVGR